MFGLGLKKVVVTASTQLDQRPVRKRVQASVDPRHPRAHLDDLAAAREDLPAPRRVGDILAVSLGTCRHDDLRLSLGITPAAWLLGEGGSVRRTPFTNMPEAVLAEASGILVRSFQMPWTYRNLQVHIDEMAEFSLDPMPLTAFVTSNGYAIMASRIGDPNEPTPDEGLLRALPLRATSAHQTLARIAGLTDDINLILRGNSLAMANEGRVEVTLV